jgi:sec-independent protein translocase protein TatB
VRSRVQRENSLFDLSFFKIGVLLVIALVVFGPEQLPKLAAQAGRALRDVRRLADNARADLQEHLGPEFSEFDLNELNPKYFVRKHLMDEPGGSHGGAGSEADGTGIAGIGTGLRTEDDPIVGLEPGESPPYDLDAT